MRHFAGLVVLSCSEPSSIVVSTRLHYQNVLCAFLKAVWYELLSDPHADADFPPVVRPTPSALRGSGGKQVNAYQKTQEAYFSNGVVFLQS